MKSSRHGFFGLGALLAFWSHPRAAESQSPTLAFTLPLASVPIAGSDQHFPVRRIIASAATIPNMPLNRGPTHAARPPFFFQKPSDAVQFVAPGTTANHPYPTLTENYQHEIELIAFLKSGGRDIPPEQALDHVYGYGIGLDMTRRDLQRAMGAQKKPWEIGKSFDHSAPMGPVHPVAMIGHMTKGAITLAVNGDMRQKSDLSDMTLERRRADLAIVESQRIAGRRHNLFGHARRASPDCQRRSSGRQDRGYAGAIGSHHLS